MACPVGQRGEQIGSYKTKLNSNVLTILNPKYLSKGRRSESA